MSSGGLPDARDRPRWHFMPPAGWMNEPHGILHYGGRHHMFYQRNERGPYWGDITWGHAVSDNLVDWVDLGSALTPESVSIAPQGIWSGSSAVDANGEPVLFFTAGDDRDSPNQRTALARPVDSGDPALRGWVPS
ncbi:MAG: glycosyl hydrolase, partial [Microbacterium sp.]